MNRLLIALPLAIALASCGDKAEEAPANDDRGAEGEVLGGTISDDMLPLDTVTSQNPPLRESTASPASGERPAAADASGDTGEGGESDVAPAPEPEPEPSTEDSA